MVYLELLVVQQHIVVNDLISWTQSSVIGFACEIVTLLNASFRYSKNSLTGQAPSIRSWLFVHACNYLLSEIFVNSWS